MHLFDIHYFTILYPLYHKHERLHDEIKRTQQIMLMHQNAKNNSRNHKQNNSTFLRLLFFMECVSCNTSGLDFQLQLCLLLQGVLGELCLSFGCEITISLLNLQPLCHCQKEKKKPMI